jgi:hypothetical protein
LTALQTVSLYTDLTSQAIGRKLVFLKPFTVPTGWAMHKVTKALQPAPEVSAIPKKNIHWFQRKTWTVSRRKKYNRTGGNCFF